MGDMGDICREHKEYMRERKAREGIDCPGCRKVQPKRIPSRLLPGWKCKVCGYRRPKLIHRMKDVTERRECIKAQEFYALQLHGEGRTFLEIAEILDCSPGTARNRVNAAIEQRDAGHHPQCQKAARKEAHGKPHAESEGC